MRWTTIGLVLGGTVLMGGGGCGDEAPRTRDSDRPDGPAELARDGGTPRDGGSVQRDGGGAPASSADAEATLAPTDGGALAPVDTGTLADAGFGWNALSGVRVGSAESATPALRRSVSVKLSGAPGYEAVSGHVLRRSERTTQTSLVVAVRSTNSARRCFIEADPLVWRSASGASLVPDDSSYLTGSTVTDGVVSPDTCLEPGELGYVVGLHTPDADEGSLFETTSGVELALADDDDDGYEVPAFKLVPSAYRVTRDSLTVTFANVGSAPAPAESSSTVSYMLLDEVGLPVDHGYLDIIEADHVAPGGTLEASDSLGFEGSATRAAFHFDY